MRKLPAALLVPVLALSAAGCGAASSSGGSTANFQGEQKAVAQAVIDLGSAGRSRDKAKICTQVLASSLVARLRAGHTTCQAEVDKAIQDADDFTFDVRSVKITGNSAQAQVRDGTDGPTSTFALVREGGRWKISSLGGS